MNAEAAFLAQLDAKGFVPLPVNIDAFPKKNRWQERIEKKPVLALPAPVDEPPSLPAPSIPPNPTTSEIIMTLKALEDFDLRCEEVVRAVSFVTHVSVVEIKSPRRFQRIMRARFIAYYLCKILTGNSYPEIGRRLNRDHSSVCHGVDKVEQNKDAFDPELSAVMRRLGVLA